MSSLIDEAIAAANEADISIPAFIQIDPVSGAVGLNFIALEDNALGAPVAFHGIYSYRSLAGPGSNIVPVAGINNGDFIWFVASDASILPHDPIDMWLLVARHLGQIGAIRWNFVGGPPLHVEKTASDLFNPSAGGVTFSQDPGLGTITIPATGSYLVRMSAWVTDSGNANVQNMQMGIMKNGIELATFGGLTWTTSGQYGQFKGEFLFAFNIGDVIAMSWQFDQNALMAANSRSMSILPVLINNTQ